VLASLEVLVTALSMDTEMVSRLRESASAGGGLDSSNMFHNTLDTVMLRAGPCEQFPPRLPH